LCMSTLWEASMSFKPPRTVFLDFPLGCPAGKPNEPDLQREILRAALRSERLSRSRDIALSDARLDSLKTTRSLPSHLFPTAILGVPRPRPAPWCWWESCRPRLL